MSILSKIKNIFKKDENKKIGSKKEILPPAKWKYEDMILFAPSKSVVYGKKSYFFVDAVDKDSNPIVNETISVSIGGETEEYTTDDEGIARIPIDLEPKTYDVLIKYPNGDYSQVLKRGLKVRRTQPKPNPNAKPKTDRYTTMELPNMKMYVNNEGSYYARLRGKGLVPIENEEIKFTIKDKVYTAKTDKEGYARIKIKGLNKGKYNVLAEYEGSSQYDEVSRKGELNMVYRDIDKELVIDVDHLSMEFKVTKDKIDTLKEFIIRTIKRNKEEQKKIKVLDDISFKVYKGDKLGILGFNGAGKSTLLKIMSGIYEPTSGSIKTYGKIAPLLELGAGFDKNYTGKNNIYLNGAMLSLDENFLKEKYDEIVEFSELGEFINYPIKNYSSGMRSKLGFSIATLINPDILIIDEILSVGDIKFKKKSAEKINSMMEEGVTVLLVSHSINQIRKICDRCIWLENGKIKMEGDAEDVCDAYLKGAKRDIKKAKKKK